MLQTLYIIYNISHGLNSNSSISSLKNWARGRHWLSCVRHLEVKILNTRHISTGAYHHARAGTHLLASHHCGDHVDRYGEDDGAVVLGGDAVEGLQVSQLEHFLD